MHNNNQRGFYLYNGSTGNTIGNNDIMSNGVASGGSWHYNFYNDQGDDVTATNNYWGTDNTTIILLSIGLLVLARYVWIKRLNSDAD